MRRLWGLLLILAAALSASFLPRTLASLSSIVQLPAANPAKYQTIASNNPSSLWFVKCSVPRTIVLRRSTPRNGSYFSCDNHFNTSVTLAWTVQDDGNGGNLLAIPAGQSSLLTASSSGCQSLNLSPGNMNANNQPVTFKGATTTSAGLYVEIYFTALVTVRNNNSGVADSCP